jgi:hypothetical protein
MAIERKNRGEVVAMAGFDTNASNRIVNEVRAYWEGLRQGQDVPMRSDIDPRGIENALEYAFIVERIARGMARLRLAGMHLNDLMGMEVRGMPLSAMFAPIGRKRLAEALASCFDGPNVVEMTLEAETGMGKPPMTAKLILLPLKSDLGDINRAIGCLVSEGQIGRTPRRFDMCSMSLSPVVAGASVQRRLPELVTPMVPVAAPAEAGAELKTDELLAEEPNKLEHLSPVERRAMIRLVQD